MKRGKVVLVPFPFANMSGQKLRPALVVSRSDRSDRDVTLAFIGSYRSQAVSRADLLIEDTHSDFGLTGLKCSSLVRLDKLVTVEDSRLKGEIGELSPSLLSAADMGLRYALEI